MKQTIRFFFIIAVFSAIISGCSKEKEYNPGLKGQLSGYVISFDELGIILDDHCNIRVSTSDLNKGYSTLTDSTGRFIFNDLPTGTYDIIFEKEGFGDLKLLGIQHLGGKPTLLTEISEVIPFIYKNFNETITSMEIRNDTLFVNIPFIVSDFNHGLNLLVYFSTEEEFTRETAQYVKNVRLHTVYDQPFLYNSLRELYLPFEQGETVYFKGCLYTSQYSYYIISIGTSIYGISTYYDYEINQLIYPNISDESDQYSFIMP